VQRGRARFELDGRRIEAGADTLVFVRPGVKRTAFAEEAETTIVAVGGTNNTQFDVTFAPQTGIGRYTMVVGPNVLDSMRAARRLFPGELPPDGPAAGSAPVTAPARSARKASACCPSRRARPSGSRCPRCT